MTILFSLNTVVFLLVAGYVIDLLLIVMAPKLNTREASVDALQSNAYNYFFRQLWFSLMAVAIFALLNFLYLRFVVKRVNRKLIVRLAIAELLILIVGSMLACMLYFTGLMPEIDRGFDRIETNATINNIKVQPDSALRIEIPNGTSTQPVLSKTLSHLHDTTFVSGNAVIFLRPDSMRFEELMQIQARGLVEADGDFGWGISRTIDELQADSMKFRNTQAKVVTSRYIVLNGCADCPTTIDRDTVNYGIILTGTGRKSKTSYNAIHSWSYLQEVKDYFEVR